jgi:hypothetical protein
MESFAMLTMSSLYTLIVLALFSTIKCHTQPDGTQTLIDNNSIKCFQGEWKEKHLGAIVFFAILYLLLFPSWVLNVFLRFSLDNLKVPLHSRAWYLGSAHHLSFLRKTFKRNYFWWFAVELLKRVAIVTIGAFLSGVDDSKTVNYLATVLLLISFLLLDVAVMPYSTFASLRLALLWNSVALLVLLSDALMFKAKSVSDSAKNAVAGALIASICSAFLVVLLFKLPRFHKKQGTLDLGESGADIQIHHTGGMSVQMHAESFELIRSQCLASGEITINNLRLKLQKNQEQNWTSNGAGSGSNVVEIHPIAAAQL